MSVNRTHVSKPNGNPVTDSCPEFETPIKAVLSYVFRALGKRQKKSSRKGARTEETYVHGIGTGCELTFPHTQGLQSCTPSRNYHIKNVTNVRNNVLTINYGARTVLVSRASCSAVALKWPSMC